MRKTVAIILMLLAAEAAGQVKGFEYFDENVMMSKRDRAATTDGAGAIVVVTVDTGQGANELYDMNQDVETTDNVTFADLLLTGIAKHNASFKISIDADTNGTEKFEVLAAAGTSTVFEVTEGGAVTASGAGAFTTIDTGEGATEVFAMDQDVEEADAVTFATLDTGSGAKELGQSNLTTSNMQFAHIGVGVSPPSGEILFRLYSAAPIMWVDSTNAASGFRLDVRQLDASTDTAFRLQSNGSTRFSIEEGGDVGIGSAPGSLTSSADLEVDGLIEDQNGIVRSYQRQALSMGSDGTITTASGNYVVITPTTSGINVTTISDGEFEGQDMVIRNAAASESLAVDFVTNQVEVASGGETLGTDDTLHLYWDATASTWYGIGKGENN